MRHALVVVLTLTAALLAGCPKQGSAPGGAKGAGATGKAGSTKEPRTKEEIFQAAMAERDPKQRAEMLEKLIASPDVDEDEKTAVRRQLLQAWAEAGNIEKMEAVLGELELTPDYPGAQARNAVAYAYAEKGMQLDRARRLIIEALNVLDRMEAGDGVPPTIDTDSGEFKDFIEENRAYFLDTLGWIDFKAGKTREAVAVLEEAVRRQEHATVLYHLGAAHAAAGDFQNAAKAYARSVVAGGPGSETDVKKAKAALEQLDREGKADAKKAMEEAQEEKKGREKAAESQRSAAMLRERTEHAAPDFEISDFGGKKTDTAGLQQKVTVIDFWASWCGPCKVELPLYQKLYEKYGDRVEFLAVSVDNTKKAAVEFIEEEKFSFPVAHDDKQVVATSFRVTGLPTIYVIGPCGRINWIHRGFRQDIDEVLTAQIEALLSEKGKSCEQTEAPKSQDL